MRFGVTPHPGFKSRSLRCCPGSDLGFYLLKWCESLQKLTEPHFSSCSCRCSEVRLSPRLRGTTGGGTHGDYANGQSSRMDGR